MCYSQLFVRIDGVTSTIVHGNEQNDDTDEKNDNMSVTTGISTVGAPFILRNPLVIILGIGEFSGLPDLDGVSKDYQNVINVFVNVWKYK